MHFQKLLRINPSGSLEINMSRSREEGSMKVRKNDTVFGVQQTGCLNFMFVEFRGSHLPEL